MSCFRRKEQTEPLKHMKWKPKAKAVLLFLLLSKTFQGTFETTGNQEKLAIKNNEHSYPVLFLSKMLGIKACMYAHVQITSRITIRSA